MSSFGDQEDDENEYGITYWSDADDSENPLNLRGLTVQDVEIRPRLIHNRIEPSIAAPSVDYRHQIRALTERRNKFDLQSQIHQEIREMTLTAYLNSC